MDHSPPNLHRPRLRVGLVLDKSPRDGKPPRFAQASFFSILRTADGTLEFDMPDRDVACRRNTVDCRRSRQYGVRIGAAVASRCFTTDFSGGIRVAGGAVGVREI